MDQEKCIEITLNSITIANGKTTNHPSLIKLYDTHAEFYLDFKYTNKFKVDSGDELLDKINPQYKEIKEKIKETIFMDKISILGLSVSEEEEYTCITIEGVTTSIILTVKNFEEGIDFITRLKNWRYERS